MVIVVELDAVMTGDSRPIFAGRDWLLYGEEFDSMDIGYVPKPDRQL